MKTEEIKIGETYLTYIGQALCPVVVVQKRLGTSGFYGGRKARDSFDVRRVNEDRVLPKPRSAAALRPMPRAKPARLDADRAAKPLSSIVAHVKTGDCIPGSAVGSAATPDEYRSDAGSIPLVECAGCETCECPRHPLTGNEETN